MTKANMMREAHKMAKTFEGDYTACLALALRTLNKEEEVKTTTIEELTTIIENNGRYVSYVRETANGYELTVKEGSNYRASGKVTVIDGVVDVKAKGFIKKLLWDLPIFDLEVR